MAKLVYKNSGEHVARIEGDWLVHREGWAIGYIVEGRVYSVDRGEYLGELTHDGRVLRQTGVLYGLLGSRGNPGNFGNMGYAGSRGHYGALPGGIVDALAAL